MAHTHAIIDSDNQFTIDPVTRLVANNSDKVKLVQYDHNSERFTFQCPRMIEGHDMSLCTSVRVQYINVNKKTKENNAGVYAVDDLEISPDDSDIVIFSWLISRNATQYVGTLSFLIEFTCTADDGTIDYAWHTDIYKYITVTAGMDNNEAVEEKYPDIFEQLKNEIVAEIPTSEITANTEARHTHDNKEILDGITGVVTADKALTPDHDTDLVQHDALTVVAEKILNEVKNTIPTDIPTNILNGKADGSLRTINAAEEDDTYSLGKYAFAEGFKTRSIGEASHAEGNWTEASGICSHAEGISTIASESYSHAEGQETKASGEASHAEGSGTKAQGYYCHAEGESTKAIGPGSHAEGSRTEAGGSCSHAEGLYTIANGDYSHAEGNNVEASGENSHAQGKYNIANADLAHIVGNGSSDTDRSNAHTLDWSGNAWFAGDVYVGSTSGTDKDDGSKKLATEEYVSNAVTSVGAAPFIFNITRTENASDSTYTYSADKTFAEILEAAQTRTVIAKDYAGNYYDLTFAPESTDTSLLFQLRVTDIVTNQYAKKIHYTINSDNTIIRDELSINSLPAITTADVGKVLSVGDSATPIWKAVSEDSNAKPFIIEITNSTDGVPHSSKNYAEVLNAINTNALIIVNMMGALFVPTSRSVSNIDKSITLGMIDGWIVEDEIRVISYNLIYTVDDTDGTVTREHSWHSLSERTGRDLGITNASVGQIPKITAVDEDGKPTAWEAVNMPSEGSSGSTNVIEF